MALKQDTSFYQVSRFDIFIIVLILSFSIFFLFWFADKRRQESTQPKTALIYQKDRLLEEIKLEEDRELNLLNGRMQMEVSKKRIRVLNSDCPQHICVNMGWIQYSGQTIACVPNEVLIEIKSTGPALLDAVTY